MGERDEIVEQNQRLEERTREVRGFCQKVEKIMQGGLLDEVRNEIMKEIPELVPIEGQREPVKRLRNLFGGVARTVQKASGHNFDIVINPCSGSDITAGLAFNPDHLVTIDDGDLFAVYDKTDEGLMDRLKSMLRTKLVLGMHTFGANAGLAAYSMELVLNGVDLNSLKVVEEETVNDESIPNKVVMTRLQFIRNGKLVTHTNFSHVNLKRKFNVASQNDKFVENKMRLLSNSGKKLLLLSKAAGGSPIGPNIATTSFYPILPEGSVIVSDQNEDLSLKASGASTKLEDIKTDTIRRDLNNLQGGLAPDITTYNIQTKNLVYGYSSDLGDLGMFEIRKQ
jgi:hypothetical protein